MIDILIRYLGIKTKLLSPIKDAIDKVTDADKVVLDLFAGSNTVAQYLMQNYSVYTNDYQAYSYVVAKALIEFHSIEVVERLNTDTVFGSYFYKNQQALMDVLEKPLAEERTLLQDIGDVYFGSTFDKYVDFYNNSPYYAHCQDKHIAFNNCLDLFSDKTISEYRKDFCKFPYLLFTTYYNNPYFSLQQCIDIDSIRYSLDKLLEINQITEEEHTIYLSFLIYCLNMIVISVGDHFAQPQKIKDVTKDFSNPRDHINLRERKKIITKKRLNIKDLYAEKLHEYKKDYLPGKSNNLCFNMDFKDLLQLDILNDLDIQTVYIDPPYTNAHYSRFYHIPETLVKYDYPDIEFGGRYRTDRYQSGFCIKSQAKEEFDALLQLCRRREYNAIISYSDTAQCILSIEDIKQICSKYYQENVLFENVAHMYRNFGQKPNKILAKEYIITCSVQED